MNLNATFEQAEIVEYVTVAHTEKLQEKMLL